MTSLNKVFLMGNLTRDPELRYTPGGQAVCDLGLAVNEKYTKDGETKESVLFIDITVWGRVAENCTEYLKKGSTVLVEGKLKFEQWEKNGEKKSKIKVTALSVQFLSTKKQEQQASPDDSDVPF